MAKKFFRILWVILAVFVTGSVAMIAFSPYGKDPEFPYRLVRTTVTIDRPKAIVFEYLGHSAYASDWSVFVHHITPINADSFPDGSVGSRRRVYCYENEEGRRWDELIAEVLPDEKRQLELYNFIGFPMDADHLATEQIYKETKEGHTELTFTVFFKHHEPGLYDLYKMYLGAYKIYDIFEQNMNNIKQIVEKAY
ncbi:MAG: hypothetical protein KL787_11240 [Taibaiella sp.]|nr:hypothetical protein [Taibaiella sp.]